LHAALAILNRKPPVADTPRQIPALFAVSDARPARQRENFVAKSYCPESTANSAFPFSTPAAPSLLVLYID
jgi:hypothetical protein